MTLQSYFFYQWGESIRKIIEGSQVLRFWRLMPKGEKVLSQKQKDCTTTISKSHECLFQLVFDLVSKWIFNWYLIWFQNFQISMTNFI
jgi:hypothetical protein